MIPIIDVKLSSDDRRALARAATRAALAAGMSLQEWSRRREAEPFTADLTQAFSAGPVLPSLRSTASLENDA